MFRRPAPRTNSLLSLPSTLNHSSANSLANNASSSSTNMTDEEAHHLTEKTPTSPSNKLSKKLSKLFTKTPKRPVPARKATPSEVRAFFATLLTEHDALLADDAAKCDAVVGAWKIGGGVEMRQYGPAMYLKLFGREYGWILYREVRMSVRRERNFFVRRPLYSFIIVSLLIEIATITVLVHVDGMDEGVEVIVILAAVVAMLTLLVSLIVLCAGSSPARLIERDLRTCTREMLA